MISVKNFDAFMPAVARVKNETAEDTGMSDVTMETSDSEAYNQSESEDVNDADYQPDDKSPISPSWGDGDTDTESKANSAEEPDPDTGNPETGKESSDSKEFNCVKCKRPFRSWLSLKNHAKSVHKISLNRPQYECSRAGCSKLLWTAESLKKHEDNHPKPLRSCKECGIGTMTITQNIYLFIFFL